MPLKIWPYPSRLKLRLFGRQNGELFLCLARRTIWSAKKMMWVILAARGVFFVSVFFQGRISYWCLVAREWMGMDGNGWAWMGMDGNGWEWMGMGWLLIVSQWIIPENSLRNLAPVRFQGTQVIWSMPREPRHLCLYGWSRYLLQTCAVAHGRNVGQISPEEISWQWKSLPHFVSGSVS